MTTQQFYRDYFFVLQVGKYRRFVGYSTLKLFMGDTPFGNLLRKVANMLEDKKRFKFRSGYIVDVYAK